jgi:putative DNA primase/helicase
VIDAADIGRRYGGQYRGGEWHFMCPLCQTYKASVTNVEDGEFLCNCYGCGDELYYYLTNEDLDDVAIEDLPPPWEDPKEQQQAKIAVALSEFQSLRPVASNTPADLYWHSRGLGQTPAVLRYGARFPHYRARRRLPALVMPIVNCNGSFIGAHGTYLKKNGSKAFKDKNMQRETHGSWKGGSIRLAKFDPALELAIGEGAETTAAGMQIFSLPGWSSVSAGGIRSLALPDDVRRILLLVDNDLNGVGQRNALAAYKRWTEEGRSVRTMLPPTPGDDFNDELLKRELDGR